ncbi:ATPase components of ABC transporters with duplicated ATPase domains [Amphibacillus marinus]|uniref:ATPase components of ABC transporters with duplicated ATPase domains n=1 Tax=Amphibacillus marinus TaxID=872970 RepID=A0A1H8RIZ9_9BACI|nr:ABC-F family ATP-binding cassette domain-containing protein [Amphibacillus marinus]SEO66134.1 ATPase components of ABC transporters with duplicated ATPase domains [Amphibacillus marinus]
MIMCSVNQISIALGGNTIFENISIEIRDHERIGLVGRNGSGKSTLLKLITGELHPDQGAVYRKKQLKLGYLAQIPQVADDKTCYQFLLSAFADLLEMNQQLIKIEQQLSDPTLANYEQILSHYGQLQEQFSRDGGYLMDAQIAQVANGLNIAHLLEHPFHYLSGGEKTKLGLAFCLLKQPDLFVLDEPTNHLDMAAIEWLGHYLKDYQGAVVIVSHDRYFLDQLVNRIVDLEDGSLTSYSMNYSQYVNEKEIRLINAFKAYQDQQKKIKKMKETIKQLRIWANQANPPNEGLHKRARNMERALDRMEKLARPVIEAKRINFDLTSSDRSGKDVFVLEDICHGYDKTILFNKLSLTVRYQDRLAIIGDNGAGKSTLLKLLLGEIDLQVGQLKRGSQLKIGYLNQQPFASYANERVIDVLREEVVITEGEARHFLAQFLFYGYDVFKQIKQLSGGERMRLRLAQLMKQDINLLILDEPTNHLDIDSIEVLEDTLEQFNGTIIAVSHDRYFINKLFNRIAWIEHKRLRHYLGNYDNAKEKRFQLLQQLQTEKPVKQHNNTVHLETLEAEIITIEQKLAHTTSSKRKQLLSRKQQLETAWEKYVDLTD